MDTDIQDTVKQTNLKKYNADGRNRDKILNHSTCIPILKHHWNSGDGHLFCHVTRAKYCQQRKWRPPHQQLKR